MSRKFIRKYIPSPEAIKSKRSLRWLGKYLADPNIWHLNRKSVSKAFLVGIFCALLPLPGQMVIAALLALFIRSNLAISIGLVWITNPLTIPPMFYATYRLGAWILGSDVVSLKAFHWSWSSLQSELVSIWWPLLLGSVLSGLVLSLISYLVINGLWIWQVGRSWRKRGRIRRNRANTNPEDDDQTN